MKHLILASMIGTAIPVWSTTAHAGDDWELLDQDEDPKKGWVLYSRDVTKSDFPEYRIIGLIDAPPEVVAKASRVFLTKKEYTPSGQTRTVLRETEKKVVNYTVIHLPLFFDDRDVIAEIDFVAEPQRSVYGLKWKEAPKLGPKKKDGVIRMPRSRGRWEFAPAEDDQTLATCITHSEMGGSIPSWLVNGRSADFVVDSLQALRRIVAKTK